MKAYRIKFSCGETITFLVESIFGLRRFDDFKKHKKEIVGWEFIGMWKLNKTDLIAC